MIQTEKKEVECEVESLEQQVEVRNITKKISELNCKMDRIGQLSEPRENCFLSYCRSFRQHKSGLRGNSEDIPHLPWSV